MNDGATPLATGQTEPPRIEYLWVRNYRALRDVELKGMTPLSVLLGPNGSGKSSIFDVFAFLSECFTEGLPRAWNRRGRFKELRTRGSDGPLVIEIKYKETPQTPVITYHIEIEERGTAPVVSQEWLRWRRGHHGKPFTFLDFKSGHGQVISGEEPDEHAERIEENLDAADALAVNALGQLARHPRVVALRRFITSWYLSYLSADSTRGTPESRPQERLSPSGDNLPNVIQYLREKHPDRLDRILATLAQRIPRLESVATEVLPDGRLLLQIKDAPFDRPIPARYVSDGTLKLLSYLTILYDPEPPQLVAIEEPENHLHPRLLHGLAEECRSAAARTQLMITTHSPYFVNGLEPGQVWILDRDPSGYATATRASDIPEIGALMGEGAQLGELWMEGFFNVGDPLQPSAAQ